MRRPARFVVMFVAMLVATGLAWALRPTQRAAEIGPAIDLETMVPQMFGDWKEDRYTMFQIVNPQQKEMLDRIYTQTLSRVYTNADGYHIMLVIAYGRDQSDSTQLHRPDVCYPAQGFTVLDKQVGELQLAEGAGERIQVTRLETVLGQRNEAVTYWMLIGDRIFTNSVDKKVAEISYGVHGLIPDGMLVRVSSVDSEPANAFKVQAQFAARLVAAIPGEVRSRFAGKWTRTPSIASNTG